MYSGKKNNVVTITKGDYSIIPVELVISTYPEYYTLTLDEGDIVYFDIMTSSKGFVKAILKKAFTLSDVTPDGFINVKILPEDTLSLEPGVYYYSVKVLYKLGDNDVRISTLVDKTKFIIND